jgi:hypothetical protein
LTVASLIKAGATSGDVFLEAAGEITNTAGNDARIVASGLSMIAGQGIGNNGDLLRIDVVTVAARTNQGDIQIEDLAGGLTVGTVGGISGLKSPTDWQTMMSSCMR